MINKLVSFETKYLNYNKLNLMKIHYFILLALLISSCTTSSILVSVQRPADITLSQEIKSVVVANRTSPKKNNLAENIIEGILTGEVIGLDKKGSKYCIDGLVGLLDGSERFQIKNMGDLELKGTGTSSFSYPLKWKKVQNICNSYSADALLVLETFDSDSRVFFGKPIKRVFKRKGKKVIEMRHQAILEMKIESGWRIYDNKNQKIIDEKRFTEIKEFKVYGSSNNDAERKLPNLSQALKKSGDFAGKEFGKRISPVWIKVRRMFYIGKGDQLKTAGKLIRKNNFDDATVIWKQLIDADDKDIASKASYNMALASEIKGFLNTAIDWAKKSKELGNKRATHYITILNKRIIDQRKLNNQLNNNL